MDETKVFSLGLIVGLVFALPSSIYAQINDADYILKGKTVENALKESTEKWPADIFDNSMTKPIVVIAVAEEDISKPTPSTRDEVRTQTFRNIENLSGATEPECIFVYTVSPSHGERRINEKENIIGILKKRKENRKYNLLLAIVYSEENKKDIITKANV